MGQKSPNHDKLYYHNTELYLVIADTLLKLQKDLLNYDSCSTCCAFLFPTIDVTLKSKVDQIKCSHTIS